MGIAKSENCYEVYEVFSFIHQIFIHWLLSVICCSLCQRYSSIQDSGHFLLSTSVVLKEMTDIKEQ